jgi:hypothetical protein
MIKQETVKPGTKLIFPGFMASCFSHLTRRPLFDVCSQTLVTRVFRIRGGGAADQPASDPGFPASELISPPHFAR